MLAAKFVAKRQKCIMCIEKRKQLLGLKEADNIEIDSVGNENNVLEVGEDR